MKTPLNVSHPHVMKQWHPTKNSMHPNLLVAGSSCKVWWKCSLGHEWEAEIRSVIKALDVSGATGCPFCANKKILVGFNDLATIQPLLIKHWHPTKNKLKPTEVTERSGKKVWWKCSLGHEWKAEIRSQIKGLKCPYCANQKILAGYNDLASQNPVLAEEWHPIKNSMKPTKVGYKSTHKVWWICDLGHEWEAKICDRKRGTGCPYCTNQKILVGYNNLAFTHPWLAIEWSNKNIFDIDTISSGSNREAIWICNKGHKWKAKICQRAKGSNCPQCVSKKRSQGEQEIEKYIKSLKLETEINNRTIIYPLELDIFIPSKNFAVEYNGLYWHSDKHKSEDYHYNKWLACKKQGIQLMQIWEDDWKNKKHILKRILSSKLENNKNPKIHAEQTNIVSLSYKTCSDFLNNYHIKGASKGTLFLGLEHDKELVAAMVFKENSDFSWEIVKYADKNHAIESFNKLLKYFEQKHKGIEIFLFSDLLIDNSSIYQKNGFTLKNTLSPEYQYVVNHSRKPNPNKTNNLLRVYDAGKQHWIKTSSS